MDKRKISKRIFRYIVSILFAVFMALYLSQGSGYLEYQNRKQVALTQKQIKKFEVLSATAMYGGGKEKEKI